MGDELTSVERRIIEQKGTERPFSGRFVNHREAGTYVCKRCNAPLFNDSHKFDSSCGWPSFDDEIPGAIQREPDADGVRIEIQCANCKAHLGHVFSGEQLTPKNQRHCVNSISIDFTPDETQTERAIFAGGCFWGVEYYFARAPGVVSTQVGYLGGHQEDPTYEQVCYEDTGHVEAVEVTYNPKVTSYETLARLFFEIHDPTQENGQGPDIGEQYRSVIYTANEDQRRTARQLIERLRALGFDVQTEIAATERFWSAEEYHQQYYERQGSTPYCHIRTQRL